MGTCCSCFLCLPKNQDSESNLKDEKSNQQECEYNQLKIFLKNFKRFSNTQPKGTNQPTQKNVLYSKNQKKKQLSASAASVNRDLNGTKIHRKPENYEAENFSNDYENFEYDQFNSPDFYLIGTDSLQMNSFGTNGRIQNSYGNNTNNNKRIFYLNQTNQVNVDGFEWDLV